MSLESNKLAMFYTTLSSKEEATFIARKIIENQMPVCINIINNVSSIYKWEGKLENCDEVIMLVKTLEVHSDKVCKIIKDCHPYSVPCLISFNVESHNVGFNNWLKGHC
ncbi:MAG: divalent-cation tolerance protein CutA [Candidatus Midichloria sp.]|nr:divalent-cation tolerance protein CutA [Candidatus Midichloria sp.]